MSPAQFWAHNWGNARRPIGTVTFLFKDMEGWALSMILGWQGDVAAARPVAEPAA